MRRHIATVLSLALLSACNGGSDSKSDAKNPASATTPAGAQATANSTEPSTEEQKTLYALGAALGNNLRDFSLKPEELQWVKTGFEDTSRGNASKVKVEDYMPKLHELRNQRQVELSQLEKKKGAEFAEKMAKEPGAVKTSTGLIMIPIKEGKGPTPKTTDTVKVHYHGTLPDGKVFDSSVQRGEPVEFAMNAIIQCWTEGLQKIKVGGKTKLVCPSDIAYGDLGQPPQIPGGATLVFEVELLEIVKQPKNN